MRLTLLRLLPHALSSLLCLVLNTLRSDLWAPRYLHADLGQRLQRLWWQRSCGHGWFWSNGFGDFWLNALRRRRNRFGGFRRFKRHCLYRGCQIRAIRICHCRGKRKSGCRRRCVDGQFRSNKLLARGVSLGALRNGLLGLCGLYRFRLLTGRLYFRL